MHTLNARTVVLLLLTSASLHGQDGGNPEGTDRWQELIAVQGSPPSPRAFSRSVWTGIDLIVWGGNNATVALNNGGRYNPATNSWAAVSTIGAPSARSSHTAVWTGSEMIVWGGEAGGASPFGNGGRYDPATNSWAAITSIGAPSGRTYHTAVWTGGEMIVWGGRKSGGGSLNTGARYNPATNSWAPVSTIDAPFARDIHTAVWTGTEMIVWGGMQVVPTSKFWNTGGRYNPATDSWTALNTTGAPAARVGNAAVWTGSEMIIWGGLGGNNGTTPSDGGRYDPASNTWKPVSTAGAPVGLHHPLQGDVWTGSEMIVWGVREDQSTTGGRYSPTRNSWTPMTATRAPAGAYWGVWTGREVLIWGGAGFQPYLLNNTFSYTPGFEEFSITSVVLEGGTLVVTFPSLTGRTYTLWRSDTLAENTWTGTGLPALTGTGEALTFTLPADIPGRQFFRVHAESMP